jgi:hypothetical protein
MVKSRVPSDSEGRRFDSCHGFEPCSSGIGHRNKYRRRLIPLRCFNQVGPCPHWPSSHLLAAQLGNAVEKLNRSEKCDRLIVITDEQAHDRIPAPSGKGCLINVASYNNGVGYGEWMHIDGWSEAVIEYIRALEQTAWIN